MEIFSLLDIAFWITESTALILIEDQSDGSWAEIPDIIHRDSSQEVLNTKCRPGVYFVASHFTPMCSATSDDFLGGRFKCSKAPESSPCWDLEEGFIMNTKNPIVVSQSSATRIQALLETLNPYSYDQQKKELVEKANERKLDIARGRSEPTEIDAMRDVLLSVADFVEGFGELAGDAKVSRFLKARHRGLPSKTPGDIALETKYAE